MHYSAHAGCYLVQHGDYVLCRSSMSAFTVMLMMMLSSIPSRPDKTYQFAKLTECLVNTKPDIKLI